MFYYIRKSNSKIVELHNRWQHFFKNILLLLIQSVLKHEENKQTSGRSFSIRILVGLKSKNEGVRCMFLEKLVHCFIFLRISQSFCLFLFFDPTRGNVSMSQSVKTHTMTTAEN